MMIVKPQGDFSRGDLVALKGSRKDERYCIIGLKKNEKKETIAILKALFNETCIIEKNTAELTSLLIKGLL
ncbi:MAG: hypothetical protein U9N81_09900 [Bacillota bacterium]|nr:hypothetical protein [Bacillota bacterium]